MLKLYWILCITVPEPSLLTASFVFQEQHPELSFMLPLLHVKSASVSLVC